MFRTTDGGVTAAEIALLDTLADTLLIPLVGGANEWDLVIPATAVDPVEKITDYASRVTPSVITSRRIKQFLIG